MSDYPYDPALIVRALRDRIANAACNLLSDQLLNWLEDE